MRFHRSHRALVVARREMGVAAAIEPVVRVAHGVRAAPSEHDLKIDRAEAVVLVAVDHAGRARDALPRTEPRGESLPALVLDEHVEETLQHEEALLDLVGVGGIALARLHIHDRQREVAGRNDGRIAMLAGAAGADEAVLRALVAFDLGVLECGPVRLLVAEASDIFLHDVFERNIDQFRRAWMPCNAHGRLLFNSASATRIYASIARRVNEAAR